MRQGTKEWHEKRLGKVTASRFKDVMANGRGTGSMGQTAYSYMRDLIAERLTGEPQGQIDNRAVQWGHDHEPEARAMYCLLRDVRVTQLGFASHPTIDGVGGSPDGLVGEDGGVEIKCPQNSRNHLAYLEAGEVPKEYDWQVQGLMWVTGRSWWDFVSFDPRMPPGLQLFVCRAEADEEKHEELERRVKRFLEQFEIRYAKLEAKLEAKVPA